MVSFYWKDHLSSAAHKWSLCQNLGHQLPPPRLPQFPIIRGCKTEPLVDRVSKSKLNRIKLWNFFESSRQQRSAVQKKEATKHLRKAFDTISCRGPLCGLKLSATILLFDLAPRMDFPWEHIRRQTRHNSDSWGTFPFSPGEMSQCHILFRLLTQDFWTHNKHKSASNCRLCRRRVNFWLTWLFAFIHTERKSSSLA